MTRSALALLLLACSSTGTRGGALDLLAPDGAAGSGAALATGGQSSGGQLSTGGAGGSGPGPTGGFATGGAVATGGTGAGWPVAGAAGAPGGSTGAGGTGGGSAPTGPCVGLCPTAEPAALGDHMGAGCWELLGTVTGWTCAALAGGALRVNGAPDLTCNTVQRPATARNGGACFEVTGGASYAYVQAW
jgi:hypothetical protein